MNTRIRGQITKCKKGKKPNSKLMEAILPLVDCWQFGILNINSCDNIGHGSLIPKDRQLIILFKNIRDSVIIVIL